MLKQYCSEKAALVDCALRQAVPAEHAYAHVLFDSMRYSLFAGGKRLRPILLMAAADAVGAAGSSYLPAACSLEMIHTYSLIHDDLPAMDDDDYRRGKPTNHIVYGEGMAILAGDALLPAAFEVCLVGGQAVDLLSEGKSLDALTLQYMHQAKTGALFRAAIRSGAILAGASTTQLAQLTVYAEQFGLAFQITDDILDVVGNQELIGKPVGSDIRNHKATYVTLYSLEGAKKLADQAVEKALLSLQDFGSEADILRDLVRHLLNRDS